MYYYQQFGQEVLLMLIDLLMILMKIIFNHKLKNLNPSLQTMHDPPAPQNMHDPQTPQTMYDTLGRRNKYTCI